MTQRFSIHLKPGPFGSIARAAAPHARRCSEPANLNVHSSLVRLLLIVVVTLLMQVTDVSARRQSSPIFTHFTVDEGLAGTTVTVMIQDRRGFIWIAAAGVLQRYDGLQAYSYRSNPNDPHSLPSESVTALLEDRKGRIWVGTQRVGLARYDPKVDGFIRYRSGGEDAGSLTGSWITALAEGQDGSLWIGTNDGGLSRLDTGLGTFERVPLDMAHPTTSAGVISLVSDGRGSLWIGGADSSLYRMEEASRQLTRYAVRGQESGTPPGRTHPARVLRPARDGGLWIGTDGAGLLYFDVERNAIEAPMAGSIPISEMLPDPLVHDVLEDSNGDLWIATQAGLARRRAGASTLEVYRGNPDDPTALPDDRVYALLADSQGSVWVGTQGGLSWTDILARRPAVLRHVEGKDASLVTNSIYGIDEDAQGRLWIVTNDAVQRLNRQSGRMTRFGDGPGAERVDGNVRAIHVDSNDQVWIGVLGETYLLEPRSGVVRRFVKGGPVPSGVRVFLPHPDGRLWMGGIPLTLVDPRTLTSRAYPLTVGTRRDGIWSLAYGTDGRLWVGSNAGLVFLDGDDGLIDRSIQSLDPRLSHEIFSLYGAEDGTLWIGTNGDGLGHYDPKTDSLVFLNRFNSSLADNTVYGILPDDHGGIWISTNAGLARIDAGTGDIHALGSGSGIQSLEFNAGASFRNGRGELFFGGIEGLNVFHPDSIRANPIAPAVALTEFRVFNETVVPEPNGPMQSVIFDTDLITLGPTQNFFSFGFAALHFSNPSQNRYSYRLEGFDPEWHDAGTVRSASYTNVDPGTYVFRVRAANSAGIWNMEGAAVRVIVLPPWWQTLWAYGLAGLFLVAFVVGLDRYQRRRLVRIERQKSEFRETRLRAELAEERTRSVQQISNLRERFFANVAHEFRTPLTLVLGPLEDMAARSNSATDPDTVEDVELALRNVNRLNRLVNELLDVARLEADRLILERRPADFVAFVAEVAGAFLPLAERTGRVFELRMPDTSIPVMMDSVQMEKVLLNLLSNAFKFAAAEGTIRVTVDQPNQGSVAVRVFNTGPGISQDRLSRLFDRFYQNEDARHLGQVGSGIGLSLVRDLTALHEGSVVAESQDGVGVTFSVLLPRLTGTGHEGALIEHASLSVGTLVSDLIAAEEENQKVPDVQIDLDDPEVTARPTILVVDDHVGIRALIRRRLEPTYRVVEAVDGVDGLERIRRLLPDLVISDVMMPRMDGYGLCTAVKADPEISFVPIILLTALAAREYRITGWETGADAYLAKPFDDRELMSVVVNQIAASHRLKERLGQELRSQAALDGTSSDPDRATSGKPTSAVDQLQSSIDDVFARHYVDEDFGVDDLAEALGMSRMTLYRNVDKLSEGSPAELLRSYRLARAAEMLVARSGTVGEICYACGFRNLAHFCRVFKSEFQCTPSAYARGVC